MEASVTHLKQQAHTQNNANSNTKRCCTCKLTKPREHFCRNKLTFDGINHQCKSCNIARYKEYKERRVSKKITCECGREIMKDSLRYHLGSHIHIALMVKPRGSIPCV
jgi:hypothetical protein